MAWTAERTTVNMKTQIGAEATTDPGVSVAANKELQMYSFKFQPETELENFGPSGYKYDTVQIQNSEWATGTMTGPFDFNGMIYPLASIRNITPVASGSSSTAKDWTITPPSSGSVTSRTYTIEQGDSVRAHKFTRAQFTGLSYQITRQSASITAKLLAQAVTDGITMTSSPTAIALAPIGAKQFNIYMDSLSSALGTTKMTRPLSIDYNLDNLFGALWVIDRDAASYVNHVDQKPTSTLKIKVVANSDGMGFLPLMRTGATRFVRVDAIGNVLDNMQTVSLGSPSAGTFTLTYKGQTTATIAYNAAASAVQSALVALSTIGSGNVSVSGSAGGPYLVTFTGTLATDTTALTGSGAGLTGGTFLITQSQIYETFRHDMAIKVGKPSGWDDQDGAVAIEWECPIIYDSTWAKAQEFLLTNLLTAL